MTEHQSTDASSQKLDYDKVAAYTYSVTLDGRCPILEYGSFSDLLPLCAEMVIDSKLFDTYGECALTVSNLLSRIASILTVDSGHDHVIVTKNNPLHVADPPKTLNEQWEVDTILRFYVVAADDLKTNSPLDITVTADIKCDKDSIARLISLSGGRQQ